jgi:hypothetical protein
VRASSACTQVCICLSEQAVNTQIGVGPIHALTRPSTQHKTRNLTQEYMRRTWRAQLRENYDVWDCFGRPLPVSALC